MPLSVAVFHIKPILLQGFEVKALYKNTKDGQNPSSDHLLNVVQSNLEWEPHLGLGMIPQ